MRIRSDQVFWVSPPHPQLYPFVLYYNLVVPKEDLLAARYTLMPDASGTISLAFDGNKIHAEVWGASMTPTMLGREPNNYHTMLLIQLSPYSLYQITHCHQAEFADQRLSLMEVDRELHRALCHVFAVASRPSDLFRHCDQILYRRMEQCVISGALLAATRTISDNHGQIGVAKLAKEVGYSERQLYRQFLAQIGMNVKNYARIRRFHFVLSHIRQSPCFFTELSQQAGYFDQSHFGKDFKAMSGVTPQEYVRNMSDFYYDASERFDILNRKEG